MCLVYKYLLFESWKCYFTFKATLFKIYCIPPLRLLIFSFLPRGRQTLMCLSSVGNYQILFYCTDGKEQTFARSFYTYIKSNPVCSWLLLANLHKVKLCNLSLWSLAFCRSLLPRWWIPFVTSFHWKWMTDDGLRCFWIIWVTEAPASLRLRVGPERKEPAQK